MEKRVFSQLEKHQALQPILQGDYSLSDQAARTGIAERTLRRWRQQVAVGGLDGLIPATRQDRGQGHRFTGELQELAEALALGRPTYTTVMIHRAVAHRAKEKGIPAPAYRTVHRFITRLDKATRTLAQQGIGAYRQQYELVHRYARSQANDTWQADHTCLDIHLKDADNQVVRPWLTIVLDDYSRAISGFLLTLAAPTAARTALALRQAIWTKANAHWPICGLPSRLYTDNGSDFISEHLAEVCLGLHIEPIRSEPGRPQGRGKIERFFDTINQSLLCALPGYGKGLPPATSAGLLTLPELNRQLEHFIVDQYHRHVHRETKQTPLARWQAEGFIPRLPDSIDALNTLLLRISRPRKVQRDGISFGGYRYCSSTLAAYIGESVTIRYNPDDLAEIQVYHSDELIGRAICAQLEGETLSLPEAKKARHTLLRQRKARIQRAKQYLTESGIDAGDIGWLLEEDVLTTPGLSGPALPTVSPLPASPPVKVPGTSPSDTPTTVLKLYRYGHRD